MFAERRFCLPNFFGKLSHMTNTPEPALKRFGEIVRERRMNLRLSQEDVAERGGPSDTTLTKIENIEWNPSRPNETLKKLDIGLQWEPGSARRVLDGGDPELVDGLAGINDNGEELFEIPGAGKWDTMKLRDGRIMPVMPGLLQQANEARLMLADPTTPIDPSIREILQGLVDHLDLTTLQDRIAQLDHDQLVKLSNYVDQLLYEGADDEEVTQQRTQESSPEHGGTGGSTGQPGAPNTRAANGGADKVTPFRRRNQGTSPDPAMPGAASERKKETTDTPDFEPGS